MNEALLLQLLETARHFPQDAYEAFWARLRENSIERGWSEEKAESIFERLEDYEALLAATDDAETESDLEAAEPLSVVLPRVEAERRGRRREL